MIGLSEATMKAAFVRCHRYFQQRKKKNNNKWIQSDFLKFFYFYRIRIFEELRSIKNLCLTSPCVCSSDVSAFLNQKK